MQIFIELQIIRLTTTIKIMTVLYVAPQNMMNVHDRESGSSMQAEWAEPHQERPVRDGIPRPRTSTTSAWWRTRTTAGTPGDGSSGRGASPPITPRGGSTATYRHVVRNHLQEKRDDKEV